MREIRTGSSSRVGACCRSHPHSLSHTLSPSLSRSLSRSHSLTLSRSLARSVQEQGDSCRSILQEQGEGKGRQAKAGGGAEGGGAAGEAVGGGGSVACGGSRDHHGHVIIQLPRECGEVVCAPPWKLKATRATR